MCIKQKYNDLILQVIFTVHRSLGVALVNKLTVIK